MAFSFFISLIRLGLTHGKSPFSGDSPAWLSSPHLSELCKISDIYFTQTSLVCRKQKLIRCMNARDYRQKGWLLVFKPTIRALWLVFKWVVQYSNQLFSFVVKIVKKNKNNYLVSDVNQKIYIERCYSCIFAPNPDLHRPSWCICDVFSFRKIKLWPFSPNGLLSSFNMGSCLSVMHYMKQSPARDSLPFRTWEPKGCTIMTIGVCI